MAFDAKVLAAVRAAFPGAGSAAVVALGAPVHDGQCHPEPLIGIPLAMLNRHGLVAGATGTGKTKTLQLIAEALSAAGVPVFVADIKGDVAGLAAPGKPGRAGRGARTETGVAWRPAGFPIELLSLSGKLGAQLRATVSSFGPLALGKVMGLNDTQASVLSLVFKYCDDRRPAAARLQGSARGAQPPRRRGPGAAARTTAASRRRRWACCCARWSSWSSRARARCSASRSSRSPT